MERKTISKIQNYLQKKLKNRHLKLEGRANKIDSADVLINDEFVGVIHEDKEYNETCYHFNMTILDFDLDEID